MFTVAVCIHVCLWLLCLLLLAEQLSAVISNLAGQGGATVEKLHSALGVPAGDIGVATALAQVRNPHSRLYYVLTRFGIIYYCTFAQTLLILSCTMCLCVSRSWLVP